MRISVSQVYIEPDAYYPFSIAWQNFISEELSRLCVSSSHFNRIYGEEYQLILRVSAKKEVDSVEIKGPTIFRRDKDVEYTLFLPHEGGSVTSLHQCAEALAAFFDGVITVLRALEVDVGALRSAREDIITRSMSKEMFDETVSSN